MGNLGSFSNLCSCTQKNIIISSDLVVNMNDIKPNLSNSNKKTEDHYKKDNKNDTVNNTKRYIKFTNMENLNTLTSALMKINTEYKINNKLIHSKTNNENIDFSRSNRTNQSKRNQLLKKLSEKNNKETCDEQENSNSKNSNNLKNQDDNKTMFSYSFNEISKKEENLVYKAFKHHYLFMEFNNDFFKDLINNIQILEIENETCIFKKGEKGTIFFIIKEGEVILKNESGNKKIQLIKGDSFGELSLFNSEYNRTYSAFANGKIQLYSLSNHIFNELLNVHKDNLYKYNYLDSNEIIEKHFEKLSHFYLFKNIEGKIKKNLFLLIRAFEFNNENILLHTNIKEENKKTFFRTNKDLFYVIEGEIKETYTKSDYSIIRKKGDFSGTIFTFFKSYDKQLIEIRNQSNNTILLFIPEIALIESIGVDYKYKILFELFLENIFKCDLITSLISESTKENYQLLFEAFNINEYKIGEIIISKSSYENKKLLLLLYGELMKENKIILTNGQMIGESFINSLKE